MLNSPDSAADSERSQGVQPGSGGEQARPLVGQPPGDQPGVSYINVTEQEKEAIERVCFCLLALQRSTIFQKPVNARSAFKSGDPSGLFHSTRKAGILIIFFSLPG